MINSPAVCIGYDSRQDIAFKVCQQSIVRRCSIPVSIIPITEESASRLGYSRPYTTEDGCFRVDNTDGRPYSTEFSFTRFLSPLIARPSNPILFMDCDMLIMVDLAELFSLYDERYAVQCVKHDFKPVRSRKMDNIEQVHYERKLWSALWLWNPNHPKNQCVDIDLINKVEGRFLHQFRWLDDDDIGELPKPWQWIEGVPEEPKIIHYTEISPWFNKDKDMAYKESWEAEKRIGSW